jgi:hypothetical protein
MTLSVAKISSVYAVPINTLLAGTVGHDAFGYTGHCQGHGGVGDDLFCSGHATSHGLQEILNYIAFAVA